MPAKFPWKSVFIRDRVYDFDGLRPPQRAAKLPTLPDMKIESPETGSLKQKEYLMSLVCLEEMQYVLIWLKRMTHPVGTDIHVISFVLEILQHHVS